ncbi:hypothetical protein SAMN02927930_02089 [Pseudidiomarina indica]|uniref:Uncharacterized protein n=1 Tax=Pseudidiomarina indica TaxID=1159017 RepID=A0A1G6E6K9_9GAMM|nr:hypothetical protein [Pseudidiomarina indica]SDB53043.1 hypothetical protein SAMN02927930_02089 [Pseudidiomarina indica]
MKLSIEEFQWFNSQEYESLFTNEWSHLLQNNLWSESKFIRKARLWKLPVKGVVKGEPSEFYERGLLKSDGVTCDSQPLFHPFRLHTLDKLLQFREQPTDWLTEQSRVWNLVIDLIIALEPIFWPQITGLTRFSLTNEHTRFETVATYKEKVLKFISKLNSSQWREIHHSLKIDASNKDDNSDLYLLLRHSRWEQRKKLSGSIAAGLWFRHIAELLRLGFEQARGEKWLEEDYSHGIWHEGSRTLAYGSERPSEDPYLTRCYLSQSFGLLTGSVVRWYVEGATELYAIRTMIPSPERLNIEVVDLKGNLKSDKQNIAMKLKDCLTADIAQRRFSFISFDTDVSQNVKTIRQQIAQGRVCGYVTAHEPDFEFANFDIQELVEIASELDRTRGYDPATLIEADWSEVSNGKEFEQMYKVRSQRGTSLKGAEWGEALAEYVDRYPVRNGEERPFFKQLRAAVQAVRVKYELQRNEFIVSPDTFKNEKK